jgi:UDP-glucose 4-epimerase
MRVAVFGASGFVGVNVVHALKREGLDVIASDIRDNDELGVEFKKVDLLDYSQVERVIRGTNVVVHLAASPLPVSIEKPLLNARINIEGSLNIMDACRNNGIKKIIFSSASSIIGEVKYNPVDEIHPCFPKTPYGVAKYAIEHYLRVYQELYHLDYLIFRFFNVYGPSQYPESKAVIPMVYNKLKTDGSFTIFGDGSQTRDFIYVGDIAEFFVKAAKNNVKNEILNMGTGKATTIKEIVRDAGNILGIEPKINNLPTRPGEIGNFVADTTRLKELFGSIPQTQLKEGLVKTFDWLNTVH